MKVGKPRTKEACSEHRGSCGNVENLKDESIGTMDLRKLPGRAKSGRRVDDDASPLRLYNGCSCYLVSSAVFFCKRLLACEIIITIP